MLILLGLVGVMSLVEVAYFTCRNVAPALVVAKHKGEELACWLLKSVLPDKIVYLVRAFCFRYGYEIDEFMGRRNNIVSVKAVNFSPSDAPGTCIEALVIADYKNVTAAFSTIRFANPYTRLKVPLTRENFMFMHERMVLEVEGFDFFGNRYREVLRYGDSFLLPVTCPRYFGLPLLEVLKLYRDDTFVADILSFGVPWSINGRKSLESNIKWVIRDAMYADETTFSSCFLGHDPSVCGSDPSMLTVHSKYETEQDLKVLILNCEDLHF
jgi:hypothetical protein